MRDRKTKCQIWKEHIKLESGGSFSCYDFVSIPNLSNQVRIFWNVLDMYCFRWAFCRQVWLCLFQYKKVNALISAIISQSYHNCTGMPTTAACTATSSQNTARSRPPSNAWDHCPFTQCLKCLPCLVRLIYFDFSICLFLHWKYTLCPVIKTRCHFFFYNAKLCRRKAEIL